MIFSQGALSAETFLREYWQKKPLLIKGALPDLVNPLLPEEVAGLACEEMVESRLITELPQAGTGSQWQLQHGPLNERIFQSLPEKHWTLHVQGVDQHVPEVYKLLDNFRFIPNWRVDDVMVSYAPDQGSAGPHFDQYDVFLIQAIGDKIWKIGQTCDELTPMLENTELALLQQFELQEEWIVEPGDILYIPPRIAHYGIARGESLTYSVGFRAPSTEELVGDFSHFIAEQCSATQRYQDPELSLQANPGKITNDTLKKVRNLIVSQLDNEQQLAQWFGQFVTEPKYQDPIIAPEDELAEQKLLVLCKDPSARLAWSEGSRFAYTQDSKQLNLYINGLLLVCAQSQLDLIEKLCSATEFAVTDFAEDLEQENNRQLICRLFNEGFLYYSS